MCFGRVFVPDVRGYLWLKNKKINFVFLLRWTNIYGCFGRTKIVISTREKWKYIWPKQLFIFVHLNKNTKFIFLFFNHKYHRISGRTNLSKHIKQVSILLNKYKIKLFLFSWSEFYFEFWRPSQILFAPGLPFSLKVPDDSILYAEVVEINK